MPNKRDDIKEALEEKSGYKKTKLGWVPEEWEVKELRELFEFKNGINASKENYGKGVKFINVMEIINNTIITPEIIKGSVTIDEKIIENNIVENGDVLFNRTSETPNEIGLSAIYSGEKKVVFGGFVIRAKPIDNSLEFSYRKYCLSTQGTRKQIISRGQGAVRGNIGQGDLGKVIINLPPFPEQEKIAAILSTWDRAIENTQALILQLQLRKKGLMQELLSGKKRLPGFEEDWEEKSLDKFITYTSRPIPKPTIPYLALGLRSHGKGIFHKPDFDPESISMDTLYVVQKKDLVVNITFAWEHAIAVAEQKDEGGLVSHRFPTYRFQNEVADSTFFKYYFLQKRFKYLLGVISPGGAGRNRVMSKKDFPKLIVKVPRLKDQKKIGEVIKFSDQEITQTQAYLATLQSQKRGLMQQLLTGEKRVRLD